MSVTVKAGSDSEAPMAAGAAFLDALRDADVERLVACLHPEARLGALLPTRFVERDGRQAVAEQFAAWFGGYEAVEVVDSAVVVVVDRLDISYLVRVRGELGSQVVQQHISCEHTPEGITALRLLCSGFRPEPAAGAGVEHRFDAGTLGCGDGLPQAFRRELDAIEVGERLVAIVRDPAAKHDLPALARLLGQRVVAVSDLAGGDLAITVERLR